MAHLVQGRYLWTGACEAEATQAIGAGGQALWKETLGVGLLSLDERKYWGAVFQYLQGCHQESRASLLTVVCGREWETTGTCWNKRCSRQILREFFQLRRQWYMGAGCPERLCGLYPWGFLRPKWIIPWATRSGSSEDHGLNRILSKTSNILSNLNFHTVLQTVVCMCLSLIDTASRCPTTQNFLGGTSASLLRLIHVPRLKQNVVSVW